MLAIYSLQTNRPDDSQLEMMTQKFGGAIPLPLEIAMCLNWLAIRQRHESLAPRERIGLAMTDPWGLLANARANLQELDLASIAALGRLFDLMTVGQVHAGPSLHDLPTILPLAKVGALLLWLTDKGGIHPMAAYRSGGSRRGLGPDTFTLYTVAYGELEPITLKDIRSRTRDAIYGFPDRFAACHAALMRLGEPIAPGEPDDTDVVLAAQASQSKAESLNVRFADHAQMACYYPQCELVIKVFKRDDVATKPAAPI